MRSIAGGGEALQVAGMIACLAITAVLNVAPMLSGSSAASSVLIVVSGLVFTALHGRIATGWRRLAMFCSIAAVVSFTFEAIGVATGWLFGSYHYADHFGPRILGVPPATQAAYVSMSYASLVIARIILGAHRTPKGWSVAGVALCGAFIMVSWDLAMDPLQSTVSGDWIWRDGGPYFGVPLHNYAGWFGTVFVLMLLYLACERANPLPAASGLAARPWFRSLPVINYALIAIGIIVVPVVDGAASPVASPQNYTGSLIGLQYSLALVAIFAMGTPVALAFMRLFLNGDEERQQ